MSSFDILDLVGPVLAGLLALGGLGLAWLAVRVKSSPSLVIGLLIWSVFGASEAGRARLKDCAWHLV